MLNLEVVMPRFRPRLSGTLFASCCHLDQSTSPTCATPLRRSRGRWFELEYYLLLLPLWAQRGIEKQGNGPPMHEVCSNELREYERAFDDLVGIMSQTQQQKSNESDCNLNANGVLRCSQEVIDFQDLFDPSEEQFYCPASLIQCGDFFRARGQIIREDAQYLAGLDFDLDFAHPLRHRVIARSSKALRKVSNQSAQNRRLRRPRRLLKNCKRSVAFETRYNTTARAMQRRPPTIVVIAEVKYVRSSRFDRHFLGGRNVIHVCRGHMQVKWLVGIGIINDMRLRAANPRRKRRPIATQIAQSHAGRIDQSHAIRNFSAISTLQLRHQCRKQPCEHFERTRRIGGGQCRPRNRAAAEVIKLARVAFQVGFDVAQTPQPTELSIQHRDDMRFGLQNAPVPVSVVLRNKLIENRPWNML